LGVLPDDLFNAPANPLNLTTTLDEDHAVTAVIGWDGGTITSTAADGTTYTLDVPEGALPLDMEITLTPVSQVTGFPGSSAPEHSFGAILAPDGLPLAETATLTIDLTSPPPADGTIALSFKGTGEDAGFQAFQPEASGARFEIDHFSGYEIAFPLFIEQVRPSDIQRYMTQNEVERRLASEVAWYLLMARQQTFLGNPPPWTERDFARYVLPLFKRLVISRRVAVADRSCADAHAAMQAYLEYQRQRQLLGVGEDPEFDLVGAGSFIPADLVELAVHVCFKEAYESCKQTGDFPALAVYFLSFFRQLQIMNAEVTGEYESLAQDYLKKCGRWRVRLSLSYEEPVYINAKYRQSETTREFHVEWKPGDGPFGIGGSTIDGHGPVETTSISYTQNCTPTISGISSTRDAQARITYLSFDHFEVPIVRARIPAQPAKLSLAVNLGSAFHVDQCLPIGARNETNNDFVFAHWALALMQGQHLSFEEVDDFSTGEGMVAISRDWRFETGPYRAANVLDGFFDHITAQLVSAGSNSTHHPRLEAVVEHEPR
jgi:hypothetical protein